MRFDFRHGVLLGLMFGTVAHAAEPRIARYIEYDAGDFTIITSRGAEQSRQFVQDLAKFRVALEKSLGRRASRTVFPTTIVIASAADWNKYLIPRQNIAGFFQQGQFANFMAMNGDAPRAEAVHTILHEYTHFYLATQFTGEYPPWYNEGMAELMGLAVFTKENMAVLQIPMYHIETMRDRSWIPFERLIKVSMYDPEYQSHKLADNFYAQAWLTVHYGLIANRAFGGQLIKYLNELNALHPQPEASRAAFGDDLDAIDKQLREYSRSSGMNSGGIKLGETPTVTLAEGKPVDPTDAMAILVDVMLESHAWPDRVRPLVDAIGRKEPNAARSAILAARLAQLDEDNAAFDAATARAEGLLAAEDWLQRRELATVLLSSASDVSPMTQRSSAENQRDLKRAMKWFGEAIQHNGKDVEALWGFGSAATQLDENLDLAEEALLSAYQRAPGSADIAMSLASIKGRRDKPDEMIPYLIDAIRYASNNETRRWAAETLDRTRAYIAERDRNEAEYKKQREDYEKTIAEYEKKYGKRQKK